MPLALGTSRGDNLAARVSPGQGPLVGRLGVGGQFVARATGRPGSTRILLQASQIPLDLLLGGGGGAGRD